VNRDDFHKLAVLRAEEAELLLRHGFYVGAYYLVGYVVECALKACVAKQIKQYDFPDRDLVNRSYTHRLQKLLSVSGLKAALERDLVCDPALESNWAVVKDWTEQSRYLTSIAKPRAEDLYEAVMDKTNGVLAWLQRRW